MKPFKNGWYTLAWHQTYCGIKLSWNTEEHLDKPQHVTPTGSNDAFLWLNILGGLIHHKASGSEDDQTFGNLLTQSLAWQRWELCFFIFYNITIKHPAAFDMPSEELIFLNKNLTSKTWWSQHAVEVPSNSCVKTVLSLFRSVLDEQWVWTVTYSLSDAEFLELQQAHLQPVRQSLLLEFHDPSMSIHILHHCGGAVRPYNK